MTVSLWDKGEASMDATDMAPIGMAMPGADMAMAKMGITVDLAEIPAGEVTFTVINDSQEFYHGLSIAPVAVSSVALPYLDNKRMVDAAAAGTIASGKEFGPMPPAPSLRRCSRAPTSSSAMSGGITAWECGLSSPCQDDPLRDPVTPGLRARLLKFQSVACGSGKMNWNRYAQILLTAAALAPPVLAQEGDATRGSELFPIRCVECHAIADAPEKKIGPSLKGLIGRTSGTLSGYEYSDAMKAAGIVWSEDTLKTYLVAPRKVVPGTKMNFNGLKRPGEVEDIVEYLLEAAR